MDDERWQGMPNDTLLFVQAFNDVGLTLFAEQIHKLQSLFQ